MRKQFGEMIISIIDASEANGHVILDADKVEELGSVTVGMLEQHIQELKNMGVKGFVAGAITTGAVAGIMTIRRKRKEKKQKLNKAIDNLLG